MFTGLIREIGTVRGLERAGGSYRLAIGCKETSASVGVGDSVAVNGVCLTVTARKPGELVFDVMAETVRKTTIAGFKAGEAVNLEGALRAGGAFDGHFVQGHIDCVGSVRRITRVGDEYAVGIGFPAEFGHLVVGKGSIAIDGVSLTAGDVSGDAVTVYLIPKTLESTTLRTKREGSPVNIEFDIIGKYIARLAAQGRPGITERFLQDHGF